MKWLIVVGLLVVGVIAYRKFQSTNTIENQKKMQAWAGAFWGALIGCFFGVAGFGGAIAGTIPGAVIGYFLIPLFLQSRQSSPFNDSVEYTADSYEPMQEQTNFAQPMSDSYYDSVAHLRYSIQEGYIFSVTGHHTLAPGEKAVRAGEDTEKRMKADLMWWYEGEPKRWHVYLKNHSPLPVLFVCLDITPGPSHSPTGPTNRVYIKIHRPIPSGFPFVVIFPTPKGSVDNLDIQDCSLHSVYLATPTAMITH